jgi:signal transduction histidine kinase
LSIEAQTAVKAITDLAEHNELAVKPENVNTLELLKKTIELYLTYDLAKGKIIVLDPGSQSIEIISDRELLSRVLGNMVKNALEAIEPGNNVTLNCRQVGGEIELSVHNPGLIPRKSSCRSSSGPFPPRMPAGAWVLTACGCSVNVI